MIRGIVCKGELVITALGNSPMIVGEVSWSSSNENSHTPILLSKTGFETEDIILRSLES